MSEEGEINEVPFEEKARKFRLLVQGLGIGVGGDDEYTLRTLGSQIIEFHSLPEGEEREKLKEEIRKTYNTLGQSKNTKVGNAVFNVVLSEVSIF